MQAGRDTRLRRCEVKPDQLTLRDSTTGSRHVLLGGAARELLDGLAKVASGEWVFPATKRDGPLTGNELHYLWPTTRDATGTVKDTPLHYLRHAHASHAVINGENLHVAGRLPGHRRDTTANRYVYRDDAMPSQAAERLAVAIQRKLCHLERAADSRPVGDT